jgi:hypothetical protein
VGQCDMARVWGPLCIVVVVQSAHDPPYEQWLVGVGVLCHSSSSSNLYLRSPPFPLQRHHSTHHPPHEQMLVRLGTGGGRGGIGFPPCCSRLPSPSVFVVVPPVIHPPSSSSRRAGAGGASFITMGGCGRALRSTLTSRPNGEEGIGWPWVVSL